MKVLFWVGMAVLVLGIVSLVVPMPRTERDSVKALGMTVGVETRHEEKIPPAVGALMILSGAGLMVVGRRAK
ncbi:MAG: hypothetical protein IPM24_05235 [Bryobacterales bacterium]|jgi:hypothetical protein|nr:hypothetical protein [Bryobacterales bacterium]